ncbi:MAG: hypothetical protein ACRD4S_09875 [Candidatus Acidiferrales bacterium]
MRYSGVLLGVILLFTLQARAQDHFSSIQLAASPFAVAAEPAPVPITAELLASLGVARTSGEVATESGAILTPLAASPSPATATALFPGEPPPQGVYGVFQNFKMEAYAGYTFFRFFEVPNTSVTMSGLNGSVQYYWRDWLAADGEAFAAFGSLGSPEKSFEFGGAGPRVRRSGPRDTEIWAHVLVGYAHETPQTVFGSTSAFAYMFGGGVDINAHNRRFAYRISADMVGSRFFSTYQYSPKISVGLVYKF